MAQRRMPSGQGPARSGGRPSAAPGPRPVGQRGNVRRAPRIDPPRRTSSTVVGEAAAGVPGSARRGGIRRPAGPARRTWAPRAPRRISGRATALALLLLGLILAYAYPVRIYLAQQSQIDQLQNEQLAQRQRIRDLTDRVARWSDDDFVRAQAASRLHLVRKGQLLYVVGTDDSGGGAPVTDPQATWYSQLWSGVQTADNPPAVPAKSGH
jgi:cell division protein FtsB